MKIERRSDHSIILIVEKEDSEELARIIREELPKFLQRFSAKNREYGDNAHVLGMRGQFADIWRKIGKLKTAIWDDELERLTSESVEEILHDLLGHIFLTLRMLPSTMRTSHFRIRIDDTPVIDYTKQITAPLSEIKAPPRIEVM